MAMARSKRCRATATIIRLASYRLVIVTGEGREVYLATNGMGRTGARIAHRQLFDGAVQAATYAHQLADRFGCAVEQIGGGDFKHG